MTNTERNRLRRLQDKFIAKCRRLDPSYYSEDASVAIHGFGPSDLTIGQLRNSLYPELTQVFEDCIENPERW